MLNWLKWQIAGKEMAELERWRAEWAENDRWFAHYPAIALVLQRMKEVVDDEPVSSIRVLRDSLPEHHMFDELPAAPKPPEAHGEQFPGVSGFCVNGHGDAVTVFFDKVLTDAEVEAVKANMLAATPATPAQAEQKPQVEPANPVYAQLVTSNCQALKTLLRAMLDEGQMESGVEAMLDEISEGVAEAMGDAYAEGRQDQLDQDREDFSPQAEQVAQQPGFDECVASGLSCQYGSYGPHGEQQCRYCGSEPPATPAQATAVQPYSGSVLKPEVFGKPEPDWPDVSPAGLRKMAEIAAPNNGRVFNAAADVIEGLQDGHAPDAEARELWNSFCRLTNLSIGHHVMQDDRTDADQWLCIQFNSFVEAEGMRKALKAWHAAAREQFKPDAAMLAASPPAPQSERVALTPLTSGQIRDGSRSNPQSRRFEAFASGVRFAERAHGLGTSATKEG